MTARRSRLEVLWEARQSMRRFGQFLLITLVQGVLFLVPIVLIAVVTREAYQMLRRAFQPIVRLLPEDHVIGILMEDLLAVAAISLVFLIAGLFVGTRPGRMLSNRLEQTVLYRVPGYLLVRGAMGNFPGLNSDARPQPALVETDDGWAFGLIVEHLSQGFCTVFLPDAPTPTSGSVRIVEASRVRPLEASMINLLGCLTRSGAGAGAIVGSILGAPSEAAVPSVTDDQTGESSPGLV